VSEEVLIESAEERVFFRDQLNWAFASQDVFKSSSITACFVLVLSFGLSLITKSNSIINVFIYAVFAALVTFCLYFFLTLASMAFCQIRLKPAQLLIKWEFSETDIKTMDGTGLIITIPWTQIKNVTFKKKGVCFYLKPRVSRWLPLRLLTIDQLKDLKVLSESKLSQKS